MELCFQNEIIKLNSDDQTEREGDTYQIKQGEMERERERDADET